MSCKEFMKWYRWRLYSQMSAIVVLAVVLLSIGISILDVSILKVIIMWVSVIALSFCIAKIGSVMLLWSSAEKLDGMDTEEALEIGSEFDKLTPKISALVKNKCSALSQNERIRLLNILSIDNIFREYLEG